MIHYHPYCTSPSYLTAIALNCNLFDSNMKCTHQAPKNLSLTNFKEDWHYVYQRISVEYLLYTTRYRHQAALDLPNSLKV